MSGFERLTVAFEWYFSFSDGPVTMFDALPFLPLLPGMLVRSLCRELLSNSLAYIRCRGDIFALLKLCAPVMNDCAFCWDIRCCLVGEGEGCNYSRFYFSSCDCLTLAAVFRRRPIALPGGYLLSCL